MLARLLLITSEVRLVPTDPIASKAGNTAPTPGGPQGRASSWPEAQWTRWWPHWRPLYLWGEDKYLSIQGSRGRGPEGRQGQGRGRGHSTAKALAGTYHKEKATGGRLGSTEHYGGRELISPSQAGRAGARSGSRPLHQSTVAG